MTYGECMRVDCTDDYDCIIVTWNGWTLKECFRHAAEYDRRGIAELDTVL